MSLLERAEILARLAHHGQTRKADRRPFVDHPRQVVELLQMHGASEVAQAAGWLHDVVEDTSYTFNTIRETCSHDVARIVAEVTERKQDGQGAKRPWKVRKEETLAAVADLSREALEVRAADVVSNFIELLDNLDVSQQAGRDDETVWACFTGGKAETIWYFESMMRALLRRFDRQKDRGWCEQLEMTLFVSETMFGEED